MTGFRLTIPGHPIGYYAQGKVPNRKRMNAYVAYKKHVQMVAKLAGIKLPLTATKERPLSLWVMPYFRDGRHSDPGNVQKGVVDALFWSPRLPKGFRKQIKTPRSGDKHTAGVFPCPLYDKENPRAEVWAFASTAEEIQRWMLGVIRGIAE